MTQKIFYVPETVFGTKPGTDYYSPFLKRKFKPKLYKHRPRMNRKVWRMVNKALVDKSECFTFLR